MDDLNKFFDDLEKPETSQEEHSQDEQLEEGVEEQTSQEEHSAEDVEEGSDDAGEQAVQQPVKKFAGRYNTVEDLEKGYKELQRQLTKINQQLPQILQQQAIQTQAPPVHSPTVGVPSVPPELAYDPRFQQLAQANPEAARTVVQRYYQQQQANTIAPLQQELRTLKMQQEVMMLRATQPDFEEVAVNIPVIFNENPWLWNTPNPVATAYKMAKAEKLTEAVNTASTAAKQAAYMKQQQKKTAVAERQQAKVPQTQKTPEDEIAESILGLSSTGGKRNAFI
jgi:hypothetical protein